MPNKKESLSIIAIKTLLAVIIFVGVGTIIVGQGYLIGKQRSDKLSKTLPTICKDNFDCPLQMKCKNYVCVDTGCVKEGGLFPGAVPGAGHMANKCCEGLKRITASKYYNESCNIDKLLWGGSMSTCSNCGNGICEENLENKCNCPEDCSDKWTANEEVREKSKQIECDDNSNCETCAMKEDYTILKKGSCGEILAVKYIDQNSISEAMILKEENQSCKTLFSLDQLGMKDLEGKVLIPQSKANYGYLSRIREEIEDYWFFDLLILDEKGRPASDIVVLRWDSNKCDYTVEAAGGY